MPTLLLALLAGCGLLPSPAGDPGSTDTAADTAALDTGATDTDSPGPGSPLGGSPCPDWFGAGDEGDWRRWETLPDYEAETGSSGTWTTTTTQVDGDEVTQTTESTWETTAGVTTSTSTYVYRCDDEGAWMLSTSTHSEFTAQGEPAWSDYEATYDPEPLVMPADAGPGTQWSYDASYTWTASSSLGAPTGGEASYSVTATFEDAPQTVSTPAGSFEAIEIHADTTAADTTTPSWWRAHEELGTVRSESSILVAHGP